jgi:autotransporter-associated beta strand protein
MSKSWLHFSDLKRTRGKIPRLSYRPRIEPLEERALLSTETWTGLGAEGRWSDPANWDTLRPPTPGDDLVFSPLGTFLPWNDLTPFLTFHSITLNGPVKIFGNGVFLTGGINAGNPPMAAGTQPRASVGLDYIFLGADQAFTGSFDIYSNINCNGFTLSLVPWFVPGGVNGSLVPFTPYGTIHGSMGIDGRLTGAGWNFAGIITVETAGRLNCSVQTSVFINPNATLTLESGGGFIDGPIAGQGSIDILGGNWTLEGNHTFTGSTTIEVGANLTTAGNLSGPVKVLGTLEAEVPQLIPGQLQPGPTLTTGPLTFGTSSTFKVDLQGIPTPFWKGYSQVLSNGDVNLNGAALNANLTFTPSPGTAFSIIQSTGQITGTFNGLPDGASITLSGQTFQIHYFQSSANFPGEVVLSNDARTTQVIVRSSQDMSDSLHPPTFTAFVGNVAAAALNGAPPPASGTVTFMEGSTPISGPITLVNGLASITQLLAAGTHSITAVYSPADSTFLASTSEPFEQIINPVDMGWHDVLTGDFNGDGKQDIIGGTAIGQWWVGISDGSGSFNNHLWTTWNESAGWQDVQVGDFNGDGKPDIAGRTAWGDWWVALSDGSSFTNSFWGHWNPNVTWVDVKVGDFNGDRKTDIVGRWLQAGQWWMAQSTGSSFTNSLWGTWNPSATFVDVQAADFDGDKKTDLTARWLQGGSWWTALSTGSSFSTSMWASWNPTATFVDVKAGDFNDDGKVDITGRWLQGGSWWTGISTGSSFITTLWASWNPNVTWVDVQVGDFNGDGKADITGRWLEGGQWWTATSTGSSFTTNLWASWNPNVTWVDSLTADFTGDGKADLTSRYLQAGQWWTATSSGSDFATSLWTTWPA